MDPKLALLVLLVGAILGLSHLGDHGSTGARSLSLRRRWRAFVPGRWKL